MAASRNLAALLPLGVFLAIMAYFAVGLTRDPNTLPSALLDRPAPVTILPLLGDAAGRFGPADLKGQVTLVNFFASWCAPCRVEHPTLMALKHDGLHIVGIAYKDRPEDAKGYIIDHGDPYAVIAADDDGRASIEWGVYGVPETYIVDRDGVIRYRHVGVLSAEVWKTKLQPVVAELSK